MKRGDQKNSYKIRLKKERLNMTEKKSQKKYQEQ